MASNSCEQNVHRSNSAYRNCLSKWLWCSSLKFFRPALAAHTASTRCTTLCSHHRYEISAKFSFYILLFIRVSLHVARLSLSYYYTHACVVIIMRCESATRYNIFALLTAFQRRVCERERQRDTVVGEPSRTRAHSHLLSIFIRHSIPFCRAFLYCFEVDRDNSAIVSHSAKPVAKA